MKIEKLTVDPKAVKGSIFVLFHFSNGMPVGHTLKVKHFNTIMNKYQPLAGQWTYKKLAQVVYDVTVNNKKGK